jgi:hypothetical protein
MTNKAFKIAWTHHGDYFRLALESWRRIRELKQEHDALQTQLGRDSKGDDGIVDQLV